MPVQTNTKHPNPMSIVTDTHPETTTVLLTHLSDGQWHSLTKIMKHSGKQFKRNKTKVEETLKELTSKEYLLPGNNNSFRMHPDCIKYWRNHHNLPFNPRGSTTDLTSPRYFGGILEDEGWLLAPLRTHDLVHFRVSGDLSVEDVQRYLGVAGIARQDTDGLIRVSCLNGQYVYDRMKSWDVSLPSKITGVRLDRDVQRRELTDLPARFVSELCAFYGSFAYTLLRNSMTSVKKHITDADDIQQQIYLWVVDAIQRYDATTSIPFAAFLHSALQRWVHDLNRKSYGRAAADTELKYTRAITSFMNEHDRKPTNEELAEKLQEPLHVVKEKLISIARVASLRTTTPLSNEDYEIPIKSTDDFEANYDLLIQQSVISAALTTTATDDFSSPQITAWLKTYDTTWKKTRHPALRRTNNKEFLNKMKNRLEGAAL